MRMSKRQQLSFNKYSNEALKRPKEIFQIIDFRDETKIEILMENNQRPMANKDSHKNVIISY